jgi:hypothetical protein
LGGSNGGGRGRYQMAEAIGKDPAMSLRLGRPSTEADPAISAIVVVTFVLTVVGVVLLIRAQFDGKGSPLGDFAVCGGSYAAGRMV